MADKWQMVPAAPTENMRVAGFESDAMDKLCDAVSAKGGWPYSCRQASEFVADIYAAMIAEAPSQEAQRVPDGPKGQNQFGLDARYFHEKLSLILRDIMSFTPDELNRALTRLANTAAPAPSAPAEVEGERQAFEAWASGNGFDLSEYWAADGNNFENAATRLAYEIWQAARAQLGAVPEYNGWYCAQCERGVDPSEVTFNEAHTECGRIITNDRPPALTAAGGRDEPANRTAALLLDLADVLQKHRAALGASWTTGEHAQLLVQHMGGDIQNVYLTRSHATAYELRALAAAQPAPGQGEDA